MIPDSQKTELLGHFNSFLFAWFNNQRRLGGNELLPFDVSLTPAKQQPSRMTKPSSVQVPCAQSGQPTSLKKGANESKASRKCSTPMSKWYRCKTNYLQFVVFWATLPQDVPRCLCRWHWSDSSHGYLSLLTTSKQQPILVFVPDSHHLDPVPEQNLSA